MKILSLEDDHAQSELIRIVLGAEGLDVTAVLFRNLGRVMPRDMLVKMIWGRDLNKVSRSLDTHIYRLRNKLRLKPENGLRLRAIYMHGYRLERVMDESGF
ncbi:MAG TPA: helix-turn-helix domain-containing protein [Paraburkholderia sp.]|nr:helix-turn-helix domain-containing protein [Paraburkholderia sp.]